MSLVRRAAEEKKQVRFVVDNPQLRDYIAKRGLELLTQEQINFVRSRANVQAMLVSPSVSFEIEKAIENARQSAFSDWNSAISELEMARKTWGDDSRLLERLGYYH